MLKRSEWVARPLDRAQIDVLLQELDSQLTSDGAAIEGRSLKVVLSIFQRLHISGPLVNPRDVRQSEQLTSANLCNYVHAWYHGRYGDKLKVDLSPGAIPLLIAGDVYIMRLPYIAGEVVLCARGKDISDLSASAVNVVRFVEALSQEMAKNLRPDEEDLILERAHAMLRLSPRLRKSSIKMLNIAFNDINAAATAVAPPRRDARLSRWQSAQAVEKCIKGFLELKHKPFGRHHRLADYATEAEGVGLLPPLPRQMIKMVEAPAGIRYGEVDATPAEAVEAFHAAVQLCLRVVEATTETRKR